MSAYDDSDKREDGGGTATSGVVDALTEMILGQLAPGASLPSEADLAARFEVSRLTVREAVKMLAGRGLLDVGRGRRAVVREPDGAAFGDFLASLLQHDPKGLFDLIELRMMLEMQSAALAAKRATRASIAALETTLQGMRDASAAIRTAPDNTELEVQFHRHDLGFHEALAAASGNRILSYLFEAMAQPLRTSFELSRRGQAQRGHTDEDTVAAHAAILEAVREGKPRAASEAMRAHLEATAQDIRAGLSTRTVR